MTAVTSAAKMVGQLRRWLTGEEAVTDGDSVKNVCHQCGTCARNSAADKLQYRGRSYSDCCAASCRGGCQNVVGRERSCSVNSRWMTSQSSKRVGSQSCQTSSGTAWLSGRQRDVRVVLDEESELCRCLSGSVEPVCCCERCFVYVDEPAPVLPPPYSELMLIEHCADLAKRLTNNEPSNTVNTADETDQVVITAEASVNYTSVESCQLTIAQSNVTSSSEAQVQSPVQTSMSTTDCLPPSVRASLDGEEGYAESRQRLRWARRQRLRDDTLATTACPPPNRTIGHVVDCW